jgi:N-acetylglucosaminyl-diphospho-decaprenol L-rhamnosyltransferase
VQRVLKCRGDRVGPSHEVTSTEIDVAIVNWNSGDLLRGCVAALAASSIRHVLTVTVVDNGSSDRSCDGLDRLGVHLDVICNGDNRGFGAASNQAAARGHAQYLLILNPDTRVAPETLATAVAYLAAPEHSAVGVVGVRLTDDSGRTQRTCARAPTLPRLLAQAAGIDRLLRPVLRPHFMVEWDHEDTRPVEQVMGAFLLIRRPLFEHLGGFDERFFVYYEDVDLCVRARDAGAQVIHLATASAWHKGGGTTDQVRDRRLFYLLRSQVQYTGKRFGRTAGLAVLSAALMLNIPIRIIRALASLSFRDAGQVLRAGWLLARDVPFLVRSLRGAQVLP